MTSTTPWLVSANWSNPDGDMSTTRGYPACSRSSTTHVVCAPVDAFVTVTTVPKGNVGLAHLPGGAAAYHVAWPRSLFPVVVGRGALTDATFGVAVDVAAGEACATAGVSSGVVVDVVEGASAGGATGGTVVVVVAAAAAWYVIIRVGNTTLYNVEPRRASCDAPRFPPAATPVAWADPCCSKRRGAPNTPPQRTAATPRRLP